MDTIIDKIRDSISVVDVVSEYIDLQKKGTNYWGVCPFHDDTNPSMSVSDKKQMYKCFVCGKGGSVINFVSDFEKIPFNKAISKLANRIGIEYKEAASFKPTYNENQLKLIELLKDANNFFMLSLNSSDGKKALEYIKSRQLDNNTIEKFAIGYSSQEIITFLKKRGHDEADMINASIMSQGGKPFLQNRITFAIKNAHGDIVGFSGRLVEGEGPKYINSIESSIFKKSALLYNYDQAKDMIEKTGKVFINEGFMDVIALDSIGQHNVVAIMGTALTELNAKALRNREVILMLDADQAGISATLKSIYTLLKLRNKAFVITNELGKDPDEVLRSQGKKALEGLLENKVEALSFVYDYFKKDVKELSPDSIAIFAKRIKSFLILGTEIDKAFYAEKFEKDFEISASAVGLGFVPKKITANQEQRIINQPIKHNNYAYRLIKSIIKKPFLVRVLVEEKHVQLNDPVLLGIIKFLVANFQHEQAVISEQGKDKLLEINANVHEYAHNEREFIDIINVINNKWKNDLKQKIKVKLKYAKNKEDALKYLEQLKKIGKR